MIKITQAMAILPQTHPHKFTGTLFKTSVTTDSQGKPDNFRGIHTTALFRDFRLFKIIPDFLKQRFPKGATVFSYGASDGSEAYSIAIKIMENMDPQSALKYLPVKALDISPSMVNTAKQGKINILPRDLFAYYFLAKVKSPLNRFFKSTGIFTHKVQPELSQKVDFKWGDIVEDAKNNFPSPSIVFFRNTLYHVGRKSFAPIGIENKEQLELVKNLFKNLSPGSVVVIGTPRIDSLTAKLLQQVGFKPCAKSGPLSRIFERP